MLTITDRQRSVFAAVSRAAFADRLAAYLAPYFPVQVRYSGMATLRTAAAAGIVRAERHGCLTERAASRYVLLGWLIGHDFATDLRHPWAAAWLRAYPDTPVGFRLDRLFELANDQIARVHGPQNALLVRALLRVRRLDGSDFRAAGRDPAACACWLGELLPGWASEDDGATLAAVALAAPDEAVRHGLAGPAAVAVLALHWALLGRGFATDPLYPWAGAALAGHGTDRAERLSDVSLRYLDAILG